MKTKYTFLISILSICTFLLCGCQEDEWGSQSASKRLTSIYATTSEVVKTRALLTEGNAVVWEEGDEIGIYSDLFSGVTSFICHDLAGDGANFHTEASLTGNTFYAIYPFSENVRPVGETQYTFFLSDRQDYRDGSFDPANCPMVAMSATNQFRFLQACGLIRIKLKGTMQVDAVALSSNDGTPLAGMGTVDCASETPVFVLDENAEGLSDEICIEESLTLSEDKETSFYFVVPPMVLQQGFTLRISNNQGVSIEKRTDKAVEVSRSVITTFATVDTDGELEEENTSDRDALIALYDATNGDNWKNNENWCTDAPLDEWYGVERIDKNGRVTWLDLRANNLTGYIPTNIGDLTELSTLDLASNKLTGTIPIEITKLEKLFAFYLGNNDFSGSLSPDLTSTTWWQTWGWELLGEGFDFDSFNLYMPDFTYHDFDGNLINSTEFVKKNSLTLYYEWNASFEVGEEIEVISNIYQSYQNHELGVLGLCSQLENAETYIPELVEKYEIEWPIIVDANPFDIWTGVYTRNFSVIYLFDENGKLLFDSQIHDDEILLEILREELGEGDLPLTYESKDYSADKQVHILQTATDGNGINIVLMGDGFSDRQIADGTYDDVMKQGMEAFFSIEPYTSFQHLFNVYYVDAVSKNEGLIMGNETAFSCHGDGRALYCDELEKVNEYAYLCKDFTDEEKNELLIILIGNTPAGGVCYLGFYNDYKGDYGRGTGIACVSLDYGLQKIVDRGTLIHEAGGHGFAKLADEYNYGSSAQISESEIENGITRRNMWGWWKNIDFTNDLSKIYWHRFIEDDRYASESLGAYEGAWTYHYGVYRPTETSMMKDSHSELGFNAPSRAAIYNRIHKLAYGEDWQFDYEEFVQWDLSRPRTTTRTVVAPAEDIEPTTPPIVYNRRWENGRFVYE